MSRYDDDDIEFDFFDEPATVEAAQRGRKMPRSPLPGSRGGGEGPRRPALRAPTGLVPLARLVGLIAIAIAIVVALVFWVSSCQGKSKHDEYAGYAGKVRSIVNASDRVAADFAAKLGSPGLKQSDLETSLQQYAQQEQLEYAQAQQIRPPGPLREFQPQLVSALELRAKGLAALQATLARPDALKNAAATTAALAEQAQLLSASDVVWDQLYRLPATLQMKTEGVTGVVIPESHFVTNSELISARSFGVVLQRLGGASTGGTPGGKHGDALGAVRVLPQGTDLTTSSATTVKVSANLRFAVTVQDSGNFAETSVQVVLTIDAGGTPIVKTETIPLIEPGKQQTVTFGNFQLPASAFGNKATVKAEVKKVLGETNTSNNAASYTVFFTLSG
jgi:CARDB